MPTWKPFLSVLALILLASCSREDDLRLYRKQNFTLPEPDFLPVSVWYSGGRARAPMLSTIDENSEAEWRADLQQIKDLGFNTVRTWVEWAHCEPAPGDYHFENLELLARLADETGLKFIIQLYVDSAPDWVGKKYPDACYTAQNGAEVKSQAAPGFCIDHKGVRRAVTDFITKTAEVANQYANFHGWDLWSEPHIVNWAYIDYVPNAQFCYCEHSCARFRQWLRDKYGSLEALNAAWYRNFESWDDVEPPRFGTILSYTDFLDWKNFIYQKMAEDLGLRYAAVRRADKTHVITSHAAVPSIFYSPYNGYGATDDFLMAEQVDYYGTSLYPKHNHPSRHWEAWKFMVAVDFSRSANRSNGGFYVGEMQAGKGTIGLNVGDPITPGDHRIWMWSAIAKGAKAINIYAYYPMSSGYESGGYGLINLDGTITERAVEAGKTARLIDENRDLFLSAKALPAEVAIVYNPLAQMVGGEQRHSSSDMHQLSLFGYYRTFAENNIPVDFIHRRELEDADLARYKLIIVPYPLMFTQEAADGLKRFIEAGGAVVSEARTAWNDERGFAADVIPGMGLSEVFAVRESRVEMQDSVRMIPGKRTHCLLKNLSKDGVLRGAYFAESLEILPDSSVAIVATGSDDSPMITCHRYGKGKALMIGSFLGMAQHQSPSEDNERFILNLLTYAKIRRLFSSDCDGVSGTPIEIRMQEYPGGYLLYTINHGANAEKVNLDLHLQSDQNFALRELISGKTSELTDREDTRRLALEIAPRDVQVWILEAE